MDKPDIEQKVRELVAELAYVEDPRDVLLSDRFTEELNFDSFDRIELGLELEEVFKIEIPDSEVDGWKEVSNAIAYLNTHAS